LRAQRSGTAGCVVRRERPRGEMEAKGDLRSSACSDSTCEPDVEISSLSTPSECDPSPVGSMGIGRGRKARERREARSGGEPWVFAWCQTAFKLETEQLRSELVEAVSEFGGVCKMFKTGHKLCTWLAPVRHRRWALMTDVHEFEPCLDGLVAFPENQPDFVAVLVGSTKRAAWFLNEAKLPLHRKGFQAPVFTVRTSKELKCVLAIEMPSHQALPFASGDDAASASGDRSHQSLRVAPCAGKRASSSIDCEPVVGAIPVEASPISPAWPSACIGISPMGASTTRVAANWHVIWCDARSHSKDEWLIRRSITCMAERSGGSLTAFSKAQAFEVWLTSAESSRYILLCDKNRINACMEALVMRPQGLPDAIIILDSSSGEPLEPKLASTVQRFANMVQRPLHLARSTADLPPFFECMYERSGSATGTTLWFPCYVLGAFAECAGPHALPPMPISVEKTMSVEKAGKLVRSEDACSSSLEPLFPEVASEAVLSDVFKVLEPVLPKESDAATFAKILTSSAPDVYED